MKIKFKKGGRKWKNKKKSPKGGGGGGGGGELQSSVHFVFYSKQLTNGSPEGYSGRSNKRVVKILKYNSESVKFAVDIFSIYTLLKLLLPPQNVSLFTLSKSRISQYIFLYWYFSRNLCLQIRNVC